MAKKNEQQLNYGAEVKKLKAEGPKNLYLLWGVEDYLREQYLIELKKLCLPEGEDSFSFKRFDGPEIDVYEFAEAVDAIPFMTERSFIELRDVDINKLKDPDAYLKVISDIPDYCTVAFVQNANYEPDGRTKFNKALRSKGYELKFTQQAQNMLEGWVGRRFAAAGKRIEREAVQRLIFISGDIMSRLIPEIEKIAGYAADDMVTVSDVEAVAIPIPEAVVFEMTEHISKRDYNAAFRVLSQLLADKNNEPIYMLAVLAAQMRKLYGARIAIEERLGAKFVMENCGVKLDFVANKLLSSAQGFTLSQLKKAVEICAETDFRMKSSGIDSRELLKEAVLRIAAGESDV